MQIKAIVLYGKNGQKRILPFNTGEVNIITGKSKTGKSVIGDIIDYCFGGSSCNIAEGFVRECVEWYGLQLIHLPSCCSVTNSIAVIFPLSTSIPAITS